MDRDGGVCWLCSSDVDLDVPRTAPGAPTVDHVVPRAHGGTSDPANLRLAHRRCNGARGSRLPELEWPADLPVLDAAPLWPAVRRALRRPGEAEVVAVVADDEVADRAAGWLGSVTRDVLGGQWQVEVRAVAAQARTVSLRLDGGASRVPVPARGRQGRRRSGVARSSR